MVVDGEGLVDDVGVFFVLVLWSQKRVVGVFTEAVQGNASVVHEHVDALWVFLLQKILEVLPAGCICDVERRVLDVRQTAVLA